MNEVQTIVLEPHKHYIEQAEKFISAYDLVKVIIPIESNYKALKHKHARVCRFCGRGWPNVKFKKVAHLMPELIGNKTLFSDFECDECNQYFGLNGEGDFAKYLGIYRTLAKVKGKEGIPGFSSVGKTIIAKVDKYFDEPPIIITREDVNNKAIEVDSEQGKVTIKFKNPPYIPLNVYKTILKVALSIIDEDEIEKDYKLGLDFLLNRSDKKLTGCLMSGFVLPLYCKFTPHAFLFKKRDSNAIGHTHVMALYFQNFIFALPVPLNKNDLFFYNSKEAFEVNLYPPLFTQFHNMDNVELKPFVDDYSSDAKVNGKEEQVVLEMNREDLKNSAMFDSMTNQFYEAKFNPSEIVKIVIGGSFESLEPSQIFNAINRNAESK